VVVYGEACNASGSFWMKVVVVSLQEGVQCAVPAGVQSGASLRLQRGQRGVVAKVRSGMAPRTKPWCQNGETDCVENGRRRDCRAPATIDAVEPPRRAYKESPRNKCQINCR
jgi:hypothetical protein